MIQSSDCYKELGSQASQKILQLLDKNWKSFFIAIKDWKKNPQKYLGRPKLPKYKDSKTGRQVLILKNIQCSLKGGLFRISFKPFNGYTVNTNIPSSAKLMQCRFIPKANHYIICLSNLSLMVFVQIIFLLLFLLVGWLVGWD